MDLDSSKFDKQLGSTKSKFGSFAGSLGKTAAVGVAAAVTALGVFAVSGVKQFGKFQSGMNEVFTLMPGASKKAMGAMTEDTRKFVREMGVAHEEAVPALYSALSAGVPPDNVFEFMKVSAKAAKGGVTDLNTAVDGISSVVNAYGDNISGAGEASDLMFTAVRLGKTSFDELSASLFQVNPTAAALGVEFGDVTAALATMTASGTPTSVATTQMRAALIELSKAGGATAETFQKISGKTFKDFIAGGGSTQEALQLLETHAKDTGVGVNDLFGSVEAGAAALSLTGGNTASFTGNLKEMEGAAGATDKAFEQMDQGLDRSWEKIKVGVADAAIGFGEELAPAVAGVADWFLNGLPGAMKIASDVLAEITGGITAFGAAWTYNDGEITSSGFPGFMERVGYVARQAFDKLQNVTQWMRENSGLIQNVATVIGIALIPAFVRAGVAALISGGKQVAAWLMSSGGAVKAAVVYVAQSYIMIGRWVAMGAAAVVSGAQTVAVWALYKLEAIKGAVVYMAQSARVAAAWVVMSGAAVASGIKTAAVWTGTIIGQAVKGAVSFAIQVGRVVAGWVLMGAQSLIQAARMAAAWLIAMGPVGWVIAAVIGLVAIVIANWDKISAFTKKAWDAIVGWVTRAWTNIKTSVSDAITWVKNWIETKLTAIRVTWAQIWTTIKDTVARVWNGIKTVVSNAWGRLKGTLDKLISFVKTSIPDAFEKAKDGIGKAWNKIQELAKKPVRFVVNTVIGGLIDTFNKIPGVNISKPKLPKGFKKGGYTGDGPADEEAGPAHRGEFYFTKQQTAAIGRGNLAALAHGKIRGQAARAPQISGAGNMGGFFHGNANAVRSAGAYNLNVPASMAPWDFKGAARMWDGAAGVRVRTGRGQHQGYASNLERGGQIVGYTQGTNIDMSPSWMGRLGATGRRTVAAHEIGHALGLPHNGLRSIMQPNLGQMASSPTSLDISNLQSLYPGGSGKAGSSVSNPFDGLVDRLMEKIKSKFPGAGMFVDAAGGLAKTGIDQVVKMVTSIKDGIKNVAGDVFNKIKGFFGGGAATAPGASALTPTLMDGGGWLRDTGGPQLVDHRRKKPDAFTPYDEWKQIIEHAGQGGNVTYNVQLPASASVDDLIDAVSFEQRRNARAGASI